MVGLILLAVFIPCGVSASSSAVLRQKHRLTWDSSTRPARWKSGLATARTEDAFPASTPSA